MPKVTYKGPTRKTDPTTVYVLPGESGKKDKRFPLGVEVDATDDEVALLAKAEGHRFEGVTPENTESARTEEEAQSAGTDAAAQTRAAAGRQTR